jgi:hypothetical protein
LLLCHKPPNYACKNQFSILEVAVEAPCFNDKPGGKKYDSAVFKGRVGVQLSGGNAEKSNK